MKKRGGLVSLLESGLCGSRSREDDMGPWLDPEGVGDAVNRVILEEGRGRLGDKEAPASGA